VQETPQQYTQRMLNHSEGKNALQLQQAAPRKLAALIKGKTKKQLTKPPAPGKWSVGQILAHLADAEIVVGWRLRQVLGANGTPIQAFDQDTWASTFNYAKRDPRQSLESFRVLRETNVAMLKALPKNLWENYGVHQERGNESVTHIVRMMAGHDLNHIQQVERIVKAKRTGKA
jgi:hypothetical protein